MNAREQLNLLARSRGVETSYVDLNGRKQVASPKAIRAVLRALGREPARQAHGVELVRVAWDKKPFGYHRVGKTPVISAPGISRI